MYKKPGYNPDRNDWFWLKVLADGTIEQQGQVEGYRSFHGDLNDNDHVWTVVQAGARTGASLPTPRRSTREPIHGRSLSFGRPDSLEWRRFRRRLCSRSFYEAPGIPGGGVRDE